MPSLLIAVALPAALALLMLVGIAWSDLRWWHARGRSWREAYHASTECLLITVLGGPFVAAIVILSLFG